MIEDPNKIFTVISAYRNNMNNLERGENLKNDVKTMGYGYIPLGSGYVEGQETVEEKSLLIPMISREEAIKLGVKYGQDAILYKGKDYFSEITTNERKGNVGNDINYFEFSSKERNFTMDKELINKIFSYLEKGSHRKRKFLFNIK